ncbi:MAG: glutamate decarboxylase [Candidatus Woesebacteria bacterium]|jgi:glutamate decarboxylase
MTPLHAHPKEDESIIPPYATNAGHVVIPRNNIPDTGLEPETAYRVLKDELALDGNAHMNLATFVTTWMEPEATKLMAETFDKNMIDKDEYPQTAAIEQRCINILADLWNIPKENNVMGTSTIGSSEACMLAGMALKWRWRQKRGIKPDQAQRPNLVMGINTQICWDKFCRYWDIEARQVPMEPGSYHLQPDKAIELCDENTIGVVAIMGSTFDGSYEPVKKISEALDKLQQEKGWDVSIHVDAASGGFVAPFIQPDLEWDFRVPRVASINTSGHKYGLVYPGLGWVVWREFNDLPKDLIFYVNYLGSQMPTFAINFSRPGNTILAQYYNFLRYGREGYREIQQQCQDNAVYLSGELEKTGKFDLLSKGDELPVFAFKLKDNITKYSVFDLSEKLRTRGWQVPAYTLPANLEKTAVLRVVVKQNFSRDMTNLLLADIKKFVEELENTSSKPKPPEQMFNHAR